jgi:membrane-associated phospholipid phosphatase
MNKTLAKIISIAFNPLVMPTYGLLVLFATNTYFSLLPFEAKKAIFLTIFISTCLLPLAFIPLFMYQKLINNIDMEDKKERLIPYSVIAVLYFLSFFLMGQMGVPETILKVILGAGLLLITIILITFKWKISTHMAGIGGLAATLTAFSLILKANFLIFLIITLFVAGILGTARITLKLHSPLQIYAGFSLGALMIALTFVIF